jgi:PhnB protein
MTGLTPYILFPGSARAALTFYAEVFGGATRMHSFAEFGRADGPADAVAHGSLIDAPITLYAADAGREDPAFAAQGLMFSLLGTADPATLQQWFARLAEGGTVIDELARRPWGASDGQVLDRHGIHWLVGFEGETGA